MVVYSSSEESDIAILLNDTAEYETSDVQHDDVDDSDKDLSAGDFVIVNLAGKTKSYNYVGLIEKFDGADINSYHYHPREDVHKKLPAPQKLGGTARGEQQFIFPCKHQQLGCYVVGQICQENCSQFSLYEFYFVLKMCSCGVRPCVGKLTFEVLLWSIRLVENCPLM
ncbi:hypothetical protein AMECASPLE_013157 [Ameca splendens]|uniref:Uncharacterized protein n=1 Tax=Ameca splendens TaxID=208324 RepID=A0ABV0YZY9_9TELE